jgi:hypothetical protein
MILTDGEERIVNLNTRLSYKPGYKLSIALNPTRDFYTGVLTFYAPDSDGLKEKVLTCHKERIGLKDDIDKMTDRQICLLLSEWIRVDGIKLLDPHNWGNG